MVYFRDKTPRTPGQKLARKLIGIITIALIVFVLSQIPYELLREERFRLYGETRTTGIVTDVYTANDHGRYFIVGYKYIDQDGFAHTAQAPLPKAIWQKFGPGSRIEVFYASGQPQLARVRGELEPAFQIWLRRLLH